MSVSATTALHGAPFYTDIRVTKASATGTISVGDWLAYSGQYVFATNSGHTASWKSSGAGVALDSNPVYTQAGRTAINSGMMILVEGVLHVSANFSGVPALGHGAYPDATGSGVAAATGNTGLGATWQTGAVLINSALSGTAHAQHAPVATVIGSTNYSNAGTGELFVRLMALPPDVRG